MDDSYSLQVSIPTDDDGFVRQQCAACGREFKAPVEDEELVAPQHCPYCGHQDDSWFTPEQMEQFEAQVRAVVMPELEKELDRIVRDFPKSSGGLLSMDVKADEVDVPLMTPEAPDMKVVSSPCCSAVLKLEEDWSGSTFCQQCGEPYHLPAVVFGLTSESLETPSDGLT